MSAEYTDHQRDLFAQLAEARARQSNAQIKEGIFSKNYINASNQVIAIIGALEETGIKLVDQ